MALSSPWLPLEPDLIELQTILNPPGWAAWFGNDDLGRSVADRLIAGARTSFIVAFGVVALSCTFGTLAGGFAAYRGGWADLILVRVVDIFMAFPGILLAIALFQQDDKVIVSATQARRKPNFNLLFEWVGSARLVDESDPDGFSDIKYWDMNNSLFVYSREWLLGTDEQSPVSDSRDVRIYKMPEYTRGDIDTEQDFREVAATMRWWLAQAKD